MRASVCMPAGAVAAMCCAPRCCSCAPRGRLCIRVDTAPHVLAGVVGWYMGRRAGGTVRGPTVVRCCWWADMRLCAPIRPSVQYPHAPALGLAAPAAIVPILPPVTCHRVCAYKQYAVQVAFSRSGPPAVAHPRGAAWGRQWHRRAGELARTPRHVRDRALALQALDAPAPGRPLR